MHPRNRYRDHPPDFAALAEKHEPLRAFLDPATQVFSASQPGAVEELVKALIRVDFQVPEWVGVPSGFLIPSVTRSLNYLHVVEDLVVEAREKGISSEKLQGCDKEEQQKPIRDNIVRGVDVGVGASCIFPVLGCVMHSNWEFVGIDIDDTSIEYAKKNAVKFKYRIDIRKSTVRDRPDLCNVFEKTTDGLSVKGSFDFIMCNPPFFATPPTDEPRVFGGTELERSCPGGEVAFVSGLVDESIQLRHRIVWFTTMLGIKESLTKVLSKIHHEANAETIRVHRLDQGNRSRWVVAWSFFSELALNAVVGNELEIDNLIVSNGSTGAVDSLQLRKEEALAELNNFTSETGICGGEGYRFRLRVIEAPALHSGRPRFRVDALDIKGGEEAEQKARSVMKKVEQLMLRKSRRWRKRQAGRGYHTRNIRQRPSGSGRGDIKEVIFDRSNGDRNDQAEDNAQDTQS